MYLGPECGYQIQALWHGLYRVDISNIWADTFEQNSGGSLNVRYAAKDVPECLCVD